MEKITMEQLKAAYPDLFAQIDKEGFERGLKEGVEKGRMEGADIERKRIQDIDAQLIPGHEALVESMKYDGKTTGPEAAVRILNAEKNIRKEKIKDLSDDAISPMRQPNPPVGGDAVDPNLPVEERAKQKWNKSPDLRKEFRDNFSAYLAFVKQEASGNIHILKKT